MICLYKGVSVNMYIYIYIYTHVYLYTQFLYSPCPPCLSTGRIPTRWQVMGPLLDRMGGFLEQRSRGEPGASTGAHLVMTVANPMCLKQKMLEKSKCWRKRYVYNGNTWENSKWSKCLANRKVKHVNFPLGLQLLDSFRGKNSRCLEQKPVWSGAALWVWVGFFPARTMPMDSGGYLRANTKNV